MLSRLSIADWWSPAGKVLNSWLLLLMFDSVFVTFSCGIVCQVWYLTVSIPDLCRSSYFVIWSYHILILFQHDKKYGAKAERR